MELAKEGCEPEDYMLKPCVIINMVDYNLIEETEIYHSVFKLMENKKNTILTNNMEIHYIELNSDFKSENLSILEERIIFIRDGGKYSNRELVDNIIKNSDDIQMY